MPTTLNARDREVLGLVLEPRLNVSARSKPALLSLSLFSSEVKSLITTKTVLTDVRSGEWMKQDSERSPRRYFNTLENNGLVTGKWDQPVLTAAADGFLAAVSGADPKDEVFWKANGVALELPIIQALVERIGEATNELNVFRRIWFNAQVFFDAVPAAEIEQTIQDEKLLLMLFRINSVGWEVARFFRLAQPERDAFKQAHDKALKDDFEPQADAIDHVAASYAEAAQQYQADVRHRIKNFLGAFDALRKSMGAAFPRLDRDLVLRHRIVDLQSTSATTSGSSVASEAGPAEVRGAEMRTPLQHPHQMIVSGCPGSGKSYFLDDLIRKSGAKVFRTQFHPETSYFDFVGTYKPQPVYEKELSNLVEIGSEAFGRGRPLIDYRFVAGPLVQALVYAEANPSENVVVQIEELNRGNPAAIFGDVLQLLDRNFDGDSRYSVSTAAELRAYLKAGHVPDERNLRLPGNLYLWATMNSADQGVYPIDSAFRRRWSYVYMGYSESCKYPAESRQITYGGEQYEWDDFRKALNDKLIELDVHEDKLIGPYFLTVAQLRSPQDVLQKLFLYLWDDVLRFRQHELFTAKSFSQVMIDWAHGTGSTLSMTMPRSIAQSILASLVGVGSAKEVLPVAAGSDPTSTDGLPPA